MGEQFTHVDPAGNARMVDVSGKDVTHRTAVAEGFITMSPQCFAMVKEGRAVVVDYKFGLRENPEHRRQLGEYIELLREIGYTQVEGYLWYVRMERIVSIDG